MPAGQVDSARSFPRHALELALHAAAAHASAGMTVQDLHSPRQKAGAVYGSDSGQMIVCCSITVDRNFQQALEVPMDELRARMLVRRELMQLYPAWATNRAVRGKEGSHIVHCAKRH
eukprot:COSAG06_NODE_2823_length_6226_cov_20.189979_4_plen_117_part_00